MKVLAAIDPFHSRAKPARLDDVIMRAALKVAGGKPERIIACHVYAPPNRIVLPSMPGMSLDPYWQPMSEQELAGYETQIRETIQRQLARSRIPPRNRLAVPGDPAQALALMARKHRIDVLVMGAISRSSLTRFFIGNTAERVIDDVHCDVLVVKSRDFRTPVTRRVTRPVLGYPAVPIATSATARQLPV